MRYMVDAFKEIESDPHLSPGGCAATPSPLLSLGEGRESGGEEGTFKETEIGPIPVEWEVVLACPKGSWSR